MPRLEGFSRPTQNSEPNRAAGLPSQLRQPAGAEVRPVLQPAFPEGEGEAMPAVRIPAITSIVIQEKISAGTKVLACIVTLFAGLVAAVIGRLGIKGIA